ncbi:BRCT domain [Dillenia turbinata]|uniref:BRCT domain n=1 Tax=Dillenia turbinata TaxID=194707 RepID=A0AAN8VT26_9MAGN
MSSSQIFQDVRFVVLGFDPVKQQKVRSDLISGGGVEIGRYCEDCSHIIVDKLIYTMVGLMGAQFSKPLLANKVTHLICYKFEGEKYDLAKRMNIKLVNHQWLEDCLNAWKLLPEDSYKKSGYELELEAEAKDSEEELEDINEKQFRGRHIKTNPCIIQAGTSRMNMLPGPTEVPKVLRNTDAPKGLIVEKDATYCKSSEKDDDKELPEALSHHKTTALKGTTFGEPSGVHDRSPISLNTKTGSTFTGGSMKRSSPDAEKLSTINYTRKTPRKATLPLEQGDFSSKASSSPKVQLGRVQVRDEFNGSHLNREHAKDNNGSGSVVTLLTGGASLPEDEQSASLANKKRKANVFPSGSKFHMVNFDSKTSISGTTPRDAGTERFEATPSANYQLHTELNLLVKENSRTVAEVTSPDPAQQCLSGSSAVNPSCVLRRPLKCDLSRSTSMASEALQDGNEEEQTLKTFQRATAKPDMPSKANAEDVRGRSVQVVDNIHKPQNKQQDVDASLATKEPESEKTCSPALNLSNKRNNDSLSKPQKNRQQDVDASLVTKEPELEKMFSPTLSLSDKRNDDSLSKPQRKKCVAKKSLGTKPRLSASSTNKQKGSILGRTSHDNSASELIKEKETGENEQLPKAKKPQTVPSIAGAGEDNNMESKDISNSKSEQENRTLFMDDDTEAPEDKEEFAPEKMVTIEKPEVIKSTNKADAVVQEKSEKGQCMTNKTNTVNLGMPGDAITSGKTSVCVKTAVYDKSLEGGKPARRDMVKGKVKKAKVSLATKKKTVSRATERLESEIHVTREAVNDRGKEKTHVEQERLPDPGHKVKSKAALADRPESSLEGEKMSMPVGEKVQNVSCGKPKKGKLSIKTDGAAKITHQKTGDSMHAKGVLCLVRPEPAWFILSGHRLQRKEFQQVIKRLKGRLCRDSHQWSYQATHFIASDPIRRTEKFFAAAASGRWILKTEYLTASSQAGKFLAEELFEWHKNGLSEDGAINLEAPRKWRLLKEKTGHGAFHGLRIVVYGDCIAPPLDTLKRTVKAGDGTIVATSPPYTRFLKSGVDFAVVTPGMPRADVWVQEFLSHEIPCIVADYLVEYVCKPGYSLEKHVLYNTHAWGEKSFNNLQSRSKEIVEELITRPTEDSQDSELKCQVCGSTDRGEVMLICGDENGTSGCGIGTHIDCCDPPLQNVPEEDWLCPKCCEASSKNQPAKKRNRKKDFEK